MATTKADPHEKVVLYLRVPRWLKERIKKQCQSRTISEHCSEILEREFWEEPSN